MSLFKHTLPAIFLALALFACQRQPEDRVNTLTRDTDKISLAYDNSTATFTVRSTMDWKVSSDETWLSFEPSSGTGDPVGYTVVMVTADPNVGSSRTATIYLSSTDGTMLEITATQASGIFEIREASLSGSFRLNANPSATIDVPYIKAQGGETITVRAVLSGDGAQGLDFPEFTGTIPQSGDGIISAPFSGLPTTMGDVKIDVEVIYNGASAGKYTLTGSVLDKNTLIFLPASKFPWGGHYYEDKPGYRSVVGEAVGATPEDETTACSSVSPGTTDLFRSGMESFMAARGLTGYAGLKVYEHGGYLKIGTSKVGGYFTTPALADLEGPTDISVEFDYVRWEGDDGEVKVLALDGGEISGNVLSTAGKELYHYHFTVFGATPQTRISWSATDLNSPGTRFLISNMNIGLATALKEPLAVPTGLRGTEFETSLSLEWNPVDNASAYEVSIAAASAPQFRCTVRTDKTKAEFTDLESDTEYLAMVKAIYSADESFNSEECEPVKMKTLFTLPKLSAPVINIFKSERALAIIDFTVDMNQLTTRQFVFELRRGDGTVLRKCNGDLSKVPGCLCNRFVFAGLDASTQYKFAVMRVSTDQTAYNDSDWAVYDYTSLPDVNASDYVFYEDFNDLWLGANNNNLAWGFNTTWSSNYALEKYTDKATAEAGVTTACRPEATSGNAWASAFVNKYNYLDDYWSKWNYGQKFSDDVVNVEKVLQTKLYPGAGCIKYGTGSSNGYLVLPELRSLTAPADVVVSFDMVPYAIPSATENELVDIPECKTCSAALYAGSDGTIEGATDGIIVFDVKSPKELGAWKNQTFSFTVKGATANTRIVIASGDKGAVATAKNRMWLDKVTVVKK